jgi:hypothetical protein
VTGGHRAARALAHLGEVDPALAVLALWCQHRDGPGATRTDGEVISYGPGFDGLGLPEQVGTVAHHVLHVALRHSARQAALAERLGDRFDGAVYGLAADAVVNETLALAGHALPRPAVMLTELLAEAGKPARSPVEALADWDTDRLAMFLHADPKRLEKLRDWGIDQGFAQDVGLGEPDESGKTQKTADWRNRILRALEAGRKTGAGIGKLGGILADIAPTETPWEVVLRGLIAKAVTDRPELSHRRPSHQWVAMAGQAMASGGPAPVYQPGSSRMSARPRVVIGLDTSSSIDPQTLALFAAEARAITRRSGAEAHLLAFDEAVFLDTRLDAGDWTALTRPEFRTGGGTDFTDLFARAAARDPSILVVLTDLDAPLPDRPGFPVIWAVPRGVKAPAYGRVLVVGEG